jgi:hypothetical protein
MNPWAELYPESVPRSIPEVRDRSGVYRRQHSPFWFIEFRHKGRRMRESSNSGSRRVAIAYRKQRMAELGVGPDTASGEVPTLGEAAEALLIHILAAGKSGHPQVRSHLKSLLSLLEEFKERGATTASVRGERILVDNPSRAKGERGPHRARAWSPRRSRLSLRGPATSRRTTPLLEICLPESGTGGTAVPRSPAKLHPALRGPQRVP